jgi:FxLD family lantipeptide
VSPTDTALVLDQPAPSGAAEPDGRDPFDFDIRFIQNTPASENALMCGTGDTCGNTCGSACTTS